MNQRLRPKDVAEIWQCSPQHVVSLIKSGRLAAINIGTASRARYLIDPAEVIRFETGHKPPPKLTKPKKFKAPDLV